MPASVRTEAETKKRQALLNGLQQEIEQHQQLVDDINLKREVALFESSAKTHTATAPLRKERNAALLALNPTAWAAGILTFPLLANQCTEEDALVLQTVIDIDTTKSVTPSEMVTRVTLKLQPGKSPVTESEMWIQSAKSKTTGKVTITTSGVTHASKPADASNKKRKRKSDFSLINVFKQGHDETTAEQLMNMLEMIDASILENGFDESEDEEGEEEDQ